jgi:hypothetical protein
MKKLKISTTAKKIEFVFTGKNYVSKERANLKVENLESKGYKLISKNSKKLTFQL